MDFQQIRYFLAVAEHGSLTRAADRSNVTQPALTRAIRRLEEELGGTLFERDASGAQLTRFGESVRPFLEETLKASEAARTQARSFLDDDALDLSLGLGTGLPLSPLVAPLGEIRRRMAGLRVRLTEGTSGDLLQRLEEGDVAAVLLAGQAAEVPDRFRRWTLARLQVRLAVPESHRLAELDDVAPDRVAGETLIDRPGAAVSALKAALAAAGLSADWPHSAKGDAQALALVSAGFGASVLDSPGPAPDGVVLRPLSGIDGAAELSLVVAAGRPFNRVTELFVRMIRSRDWCGALDGATVAEGVQG